MFRGKVYVPNNIELRRKIVSLHHDTTIAGHPGRWKTMELITHNCWWPGMTKFVTEYIKGCDTCNRTKTIPVKPIGKLMLNLIPERLWEHITADMVIGLPPSQGSNLILVVVDHYSKQAHFITTTQELSSIGQAKLYLENVWKLHGLPQSIISDRGSTFASKLMKELNEMLRIKTKLSPAYPPQPDGQTEHANQEIKQYL